MLSPSEIQSLFQGLAPAQLPEDAAGQARGAPSAAEQFLLPLALDTSEQALLQRWQTAFIRHWIETWPVPLRKRFSLDKAIPDLIRLQDFVPKLVQGRAFQVTAADPSHAMWIAFDPVFAATHINCLLGDHESEIDPDTIHPWGAVEQQLTSRLILKACALLFPDRTGNSEDRWHIAGIGTVSECLAQAPVYLSSELVLFTFDFIGARSIGASSPIRLQLALPRTLFRNRIGECSFPQFLGESPAAPRTIEVLNGVTVQAVMPRLKLSAAEFSQLQPGDVLLTGQSELTCLITVDGEKTFTAQLGSHEGHKAVRIVTDTDSASDAG